VDKYYMVLHVRKIFWTDHGWPVVSPQRFVEVEQTAVSIGELAGTWEYIKFGYTVVPGFAAEQVSPNFQEAVELHLNADGTFNGDMANKWVYQSPWLALHWGSGSFDKVRVERGRDWENKKSCLIFTGLNNEGTAIWGKK
jgi:arabinan endo-1,5-alpha-L-arabinosidase